MENARITKSLIFLLILALSIFLANKAVISSSSHNSSTLSDTVQITVSAGWNLISLPIIPADPRTKVLFPHAISDAYAYSGFYNIRDSLRPGIGYWMKFAIPENVTLIGTLYSALSIDLTPGWNLIGSSNKTITKGELFSDPCGTVSTQYFRYNPGGGYITTDTLEPGNGFWLKAAQNYALFQPYWEKISDLYDASVTVHPTQPNILFAGTPSNFSVPRNGAIMKSIDWGASWDTLVSNVDARYIVLDLKNPDIGYAPLSIANLCIPGILKTTNGGTTWFHADSGISLNWETGVGWLLIDPNNGNTLYAQAGGPMGSKQYKTTNGGMFWSELINYGSLNCSVDTLCFFGWGVDMAIDPQNSSVLYALTGYSTLVRILFRSTSGGDTWDVIHQFPNSWYGGDIRVNLKDSNTLYVGGRSFGISTDRGQTWYNSSNGLPDSISIENISLSKDPKMIYCFARSNTPVSSIYRTTDGGFNWQNIISDSSYMKFHPPDETDGFIYVSKVQGLYYPAEFDGIYKARICKPTKN